MPVIGTGGHVDHGKSTLVRALTGRDPDRWQEEKERGLTIDLGFAWTRLGGIEVSFVDVPGHERFIKNMLAGTGGFDIALLVVAADEGWMPQSEEHLAVLDLLEIGHGVVAITMIDRAEADLVELAVLETEDQLSGTVLEGAPIVPVSAVTGEGLEELRSALVSVLEEAPKRSSGRTRLWIDRVFPVSGTGTVVTGTLVGGCLSVGDQVEVFPGAHQGRVRSLQAHEEERTTVQSGTRTAAGIAGLDRRAVARGSMLGHPGQWAPSSRLLVAVRTARYMQVPLTRRGAYQLHLGSGVWPVRLTPLGSDDEEAVAVLRVDTPAPVRMGDRFVLRDVGRRLIVAGGRVVEPVAPRKGRDARAAGAVLRPSLGLGSAGRAAALLEWRGVEKAAILAAHSGGAPTEGAIPAGPLLLAASYVDGLVERAGSLTRDFHKQSPLRPGISKASLASLLDVGLETLAAALKNADGLEQHGSVVALTSFTPSLDEEHELEWRRIEAKLEESGPTPPRLKELEMDPELLHALVRRGSLIRISDDLAYLPAQVETLMDRLSELPARFTVAAFRDMTGLTRKYAVPLLEWMDRCGITVRYGDEREVGGQVSLASLTGEGSVFSA